jgi:hypothetical protein
VLRSLAVAASPAFEVVKLVLSTRGYSIGERMTALASLTGIRLYRAKTMLSLLRNDHSRRIVNSWNRD